MALSRDIDPFANIDYYHPHDAILSQDAAKYKLQSNFYRRTRGNIDSRNSILVSDPWSGFDFQYLEYHSFVQSSPSPSPIQSREGRAFVGSILPSFVPFLSLTLTLSLSLLPIHFLSDFSPFFLPPARPPVRLSEPLPFARSVL